MCIRDRDDRVSVGEDLQMVFAAALDARKVCVVQDYYPYHYWYNMSSMTGQYDGKYLEMCIRDSCGGSCRSEQLQESRYLYGAGGRHITGWIFLSFRSDGGCKA